MMLCAKQRYDELEKIRTQQANYDKQYYSESDPFKITEEDTNEDVLAKIQSIRDIAVARYG